MNALHDEEQQNNVYLGCFVAGFPVLAVKLGGVGLLQITFEALSKNKNTADTCNTLPAGFHHGHHKMYNDFIAVLDGSTYHS